MKITELVTTLQLGDRVRFAATLDRVYQPVERDPAADPYFGLLGRKVWERRPIPSFRTARPAEGIIVGARTVFDGFVEYGWEDNPTVFKSDRSHRVYLVATGLRTKHLVVAVEDIEPVIAPLRIVPDRPASTSGIAAPAGHWPIGSPA